MLELLDQVPSAFGGESKFFYLVLTEKLFLSSHNHQTRVFSGHRRCKEELIMADGLDVHCLRYWVEFDVHGNKREKWSSIYFTSCYESDAKMKDSAHQNSFYLIPLGGRLPWLQFEDFASHHTFTHSHANNSDHT